MKTPRKALTRITAILCLTALGLSLAGCGLLPKKVEFGQAKVPAFPAKTDSQKELERQTAAKLVEKTSQVRDLVTFYQDEVPEAVKPAQEASDLAGGLSISLGPPSSPWRGESEALVARLEATVARQNKALDKLADRLDKYEGKKIEGTGVVQMPYVVYVGVVLGGLALLLALIHAGLNIGSLFNPGVAAAKGIVDAGLGLGSKAVSQLVKGGGDFLKAVENSKLATETKAEIKQLFFSAHKSAQDSDVKSLVQTLPGANKQ